jgi:hypothetical protein
LEVGFLTAGLEDLAALVGFELGAETAFFLTGEDLRAGTLTVAFDRTLTGPFTGSFALALTDAGFAWEADFLT